MIVFTFSWKNHIKPVMICVTYKTGVTFRFLIVKAVEAKRWLDADWFRVLIIKIL